MCAKCYLLWQKIWYWIAVCDLVWPYVVLFGRMWPCMIFCGRICVNLSSCMAFSWSCMAFYGRLWQNINFIGLVSFLAVIDPNSFGLVQTKRPCLVIIIWRKMHGLSERDQLFPILEGKVKILTRIWLIGVLPLSPPP